MAGAHAGGAELFFERLSIALHQAGDAVLTAIRRDRDRARRLAEAGLPAMQLAFGGPADWLTGPRLRRLLRRFAPRVVVAWMSRAAKFAPPGEWVLAGRLGGYYNLSYYKRCDHLIGNTRSIVAWITAQGWPASRVHHLPNFTEDLAGAVPADRRALGVPAGVPLLLALGRLHPNKGFDVLVRALALLPGVHALLAGEGQEQRRILELARREGVADRLHLLGWRSDRGALLATADLLVCPSRHEPLGNVIIEGWSAVRPVVAADADGPRELIRPGADGLLAAREDAGALADAIGAVLHDPARARALALAGRSRFEAEFAQASVVASWRAFLGSVEKP
ncbi:MAG: glycosyltransferase [Acetobacteraceae bacterium]|nr:glycosyltransferase [Acetobacteraceae bacterium]